MTASTQYRAPCLAKPARPRQQFLNERLTAAAGRSERRGIIAPDSNSEDAPHGHARPASPHGAASADAATIRSPRPLLLLRRRGRGRRALHRLRAVAALAGRAGHARRAVAADRGRRRELQHRAGGDPPRHPAPPGHAGARRPRLSVALAHAARPESEADASARRSIPTSGCSSPSPPAKPRCRS